MTNFNNNNEDELEKLRIENELKKMKMMLEHGAKFSEPMSDNIVSAAIEKKFLDNIEEYEMNFKNAEQIVLYDFIEKPEYLLAEAIPETQIGAELDRIMDILNKNGIQLDTICDVDEREIYRFVTEELFQHEMDNMRIPGMMNCFIYEEFHPNHEYDIRLHSTDGVKSFLNKKTDYYTTFFTKEAMQDTSMTHFRDAFISFSLKHLKFTHLEFDEEKAIVDFEIDFTGKIEGSTEKQCFKGEGSVELIYQYDYWCIQMINFPKGQ